MIKNKGVLIVGSNGTGKTTFIIDNVCKKLSHYCIVACSNEKSFENFGTEILFNSDENVFYTKDKEIISIQEAHKKYKKIIIYFENKSLIQKGAYKSFSLLCVHLADLQSTNIVLDDIRSVLHNNVNASLKSLFVVFRQKKCNLFAIYHSLNDVHKSLLTHFTYLVLFRTKDYYLKEHVKYLEYCKNLTDKEAKENEHAYNIFKL